MYYNEDTDDDIFFIGTFKTEPIMKNYIYMLTNKDGIITDVSSNALGFFRFDAASLKKSKPNINTIAPKALVERAYRNTKVGKDIYYRNKHIHPQELQKFNCYIEALLFSESISDSKTDKVVYGYKVRLEFISSEKLEGNSRQATLSHANSYEKKEENNTTDFPTNNNSTYINKFENQITTEFSNYYTEYQEKLAIFEETYHDKDIFDY